MYLNFLLQDERSLPNVSKPFLSELSGNQLGFLHCMIIVSQGGKYEAVVNAIPLVGAAEGLMKRTGLFRVQERKDIQTIQRYLRDDYLKELVSTLYDLPDSQKSRQYYLDYIESVFKQCNKGGGMYYNITLVLSCMGTYFLSNLLNCQNSVHIRMYILSLNGTTTYICS